MIYGHTKSNSSSGNKRIPIYHELLDQLKSYSDTIIVNQFLNTDKKLSVYDVKKLSFYDKSYRTLKERLNALVCRGILSKISTTSLYNKSYYTISQNIDVPTSTKTATVVESKNMYLGDYYIAAIINYFRSLVESGSKQISLSIPQIINNLRFDISETAVRKRMNLLSANKIIKRKLVGRIYTYNLESDYLLERYTPKLISYESRKLEEIFTHHLNRENEKAPKNLYLSFTEMLNSGYKFQSIKHIISYLNLYEYRTKILTVKSLCDNYQELSNLAVKTLSKRKANRVIYKLSNHKVALKKVVRCNHNTLWDQVYELVESRLAQIKFMHYKYSYNTSLEIDDLISEYMLFLYKKCSTSNIEPKEIATSTIHGYIRKYCSKARNGSSADKIDVERVPAVSIVGGINEVELVYDNDNPLDYILDKYKEIPVEAMGVIIDILGVNGVVLTQREASVKYKMSLSSFNNYIKPYMDKVKKLAGVSGYPEDILDCRCSP